MSVWEDVKKAFAEGKFKTYARWGGILNVFGIIISLFIFHGCVTHIIVGVAASVLVGILELPFCCTCLVCCNKIAEHLKFFEIYFARGIFYMFLGACMCALLAMKVRTPLHHCSDRRVNRHHGAVFVSGRQVLCRSILGTRPDLHWRVLLCRALPRREVRGLGCQCAGPGH